MRLVLLTILAGIVIALAGCATNDRPQDPDRVSSIPWNKPQPWEGQGPFGGLMQGAR